MSNQWSFKTNYQKVDQYTGGKLLNHGNKHLKDNQLQSLEIHITVTS